MATTVADGLWRRLTSAGVSRCYGVVGDALNPVFDPSRLGRRTPVDLAVAGDVRATLGALMPLLSDASPNAFGAQMAFPGRQTIALCGDGGFSMGALGDLLTEVEHRAGGPVVVDAVVDPYALALPGHVPAATALGFTLGLARQVLAGHLDEVRETARHNVKLF